MLSGSLPSAAGIRGAPRDGLSLICPIEDTLKFLPSTRYYGSKRKLLPWIYESIKSLQFDTALDLFGGTASVSLLFRMMRKQVTYHDGFKFNEDVGNVLLTDLPRMTKPELEDFLTSVTSRQGFIADTFKGIFYTDLENRWLDGMVEQLRHSCDPALLRYLLYQACLKKRPFNLFHRANLRLRVAEGVSRSFGNYATWEKPFADHMVKAYDELAFYMTPLAPAAKVLPSGNAEDLAPGYDLVYIDPPYVSLSTNYNRDDYWRRYHFLEGLARHDEWASLIDRNSDVRLINEPSWMRAWGRQESFRDLLFSLITKHRESIVVLSYVTGACPNESEIKNFFDSLFPETSVRSKEHSHALSRETRRELIFIGVPR